MSYENVEFEFIMTGNMKIVTDVIIPSNIPHTKVIECHIDEEVVAYQVWSLKTMVLNEKARKVFSLSVGEFLSIVNNNPEYTPRSVLTFGSNEIDICTVTKIFGGNNTNQKGNFVVYVCIDESKGSTVSFTDTVNAKLNLSSMPYYMMNKGGTLYPTPFGSHVKNLGTISDVQFKTPLYNYILREDADVTIKDGIIDATIYNRCKLIKYQQWSASTLELNSDRLSECIPISDFILLVKDNKTNFDPTVTVCINKKFYLGVLIDINVDNNYETEIFKENIFDRFSLSDENVSEFVNIKIDTTRMVDVNGNSIPVEDGSFGKSALYMNIDDSTTPETISVADVINQQGIVKSGQILNIPDVNDNYITKKSDYGSLNTINNQGIINILPYNTQTTTSSSLLRSNTSNNIGGSYRNHTQNDKTTHYYTSIYVPDGCLFKNNGTINIGNLDNKSEIPVLNVANDNITENYIQVEDKATFMNMGTITLENHIQVNTHQTFSIINQLENKGIIRFETIENTSNDYSLVNKLTTSMPPVVCGIQTLLNSMTELPTMESPSSLVQFSSIMTTGQNAVTAGIVKCLSNNGTIYIDRVINGDPSKLAVPSASNGYAEYQLPLIQNGNQNTYGIMYMGEINPTKNSPLNSMYETLTENKHFINYQLMPYEYLNNLSPPGFNWDNSNLDPRLITTVSGNGGVIKINSVENYSPYDNVLVSNKCVGVMNTIQLRDNYLSDGNMMALTSIGKVANYGYGGNLACMGITNLVLNCSAVRIDNIENWTPNDYVNDSNPLFDDSNSIATGILHVSQNGFNGLKLLNQDRYTTKNTTIKAFVPPYPPENFQKEGVPSVQNDQLIIQFYNDGNYTPYEETVMYDQGHISIGCVNNLGTAGSLCEGVSQYGCMSYSNDIMNDKAIISTLKDCSSELFDFVTFNNKFATAWSFPTSDNLQLGFGLVPNDLSADDVASYGWAPQVNSKGSAGPTQMYYVYDSKQLETTNCVFYPMNWGMITINSVNAGSISTLNDNNNITELSNLLSSSNTVINKGGSSYGIERLLSSMGRIQILNITSSNTQTNNPISTSSKLTVNTEENPELSNQMGISNYTTLSVDYTKIDLLMAVNDNSVNDLPITITMPHSYVMDPTANVNGIWLNRTGNTINYRSPYSICYNTLKDYYSDPSMATFKKKFIEKKPQNDDDSPFNFNNIFSGSGIGEGGGKNLLPILSSRGASYGVYRTLDYSSTAPGLRAIVDYSTPLEESNEFNDYKEGWAPGNTEQVAKPTDIQVLNYLAYGGIGEFQEIAGFSCNVEIGMITGGSVKAVSGQLLNTYDNFGGNTVSWQVPTRAWGPGNATSVWGGSESNSQGKSANNACAPLKWLIDMNQQFSAPYPKTPSQIRTQNGWIPTYDSSPAVSSVVAGAWFPSDTHLASPWNTFWAIPNQGKGNTSTSFGGCSLIGGKDGYPGQGVNDDTQGTGLNPSLLSGGWSQFTTYWSAGINKYSISQMPVTNTQPDNSDPVYMDQLVQDRLVNTDAAGVDLTITPGVVPYPRIWNSEIDMIKIENGWVDADNLTIYEATLPFPIATNDVYQAATGIIQPYAKTYNNPYFNNKPSVGPPSFSDDQQPKEMVHLWNVIQNGKVLPPKYLWSNPVLNNYKDALMATGDYSVGLVAPNLFPSGWPGLSNLPPLLTVYFNDDVAVYGPQQGYAGPYGEYESIRINEETGDNEYMENFMPCFYSTTRPVGTSYQYMNSNNMYYMPNNEIPQYLNDEEPIYGSKSSVILPNSTMFYSKNKINQSGEHELVYESDGGYNSKNYEFLYNGAISVNTFKNGCTGFSTLTKGSEFIVPLNPSTSSSGEVLMYNEQFGLDDKCSSKYHTANSYYGFSVEIFTQNARRQYNQYYAILGPYLQYQAFSQTIPAYDAQGFQELNATYIKAANAKAQAAKEAKEQAEAAMKKENNSVGQDVMMDLGMFFMFL